jgi:diacylglycerol O-acyltransferase / wax synthase
VTEHLTPLDATFLELEQSSEAAHMHIGAVMVFDPIPGGGAPGLDQVCHHLRERLEAMPRFRQRLSASRTGGLSWPSWEEDPGFQLSRHVRRAALPAPGGRAELLAWAAEFWSQRLDREHPLWDMVVLEGLAGGRWALCSKTHHCMVDGVGSVDIAHLLLDGGPVAPNGTSAASLSPAVNARRHNGPANALLALPRAMAQGVRAGVQTIAHPARLSAMLERARAVAELVVRDEVVAAPRTSLNVPIGARRTIAVVEAPLSDLRRVKVDLGGTINDVVLAAVTGGLRRLLEHRGEPLPPQGLRAMVPVNVRAGAEHLALGNKITSLFVHLPVAESDPAARYARVLAEAEGLKSGSQGVGGAALIQLTGLAPPALHAFLARSLFASRLFNLTVTNVPGPQTTLYAFGAAMRWVVGLVPLAEDHTVGIAILSYDGRMTFTLAGDHDTMPDLEVLAGGIKDSLAELRALALDAESEEDDAGEMVAVGGEPTSLEGHV